jgi:trehalose 6-phosphate synthase
MSRIVMVSNRTADPSKAQLSGGLAVAVLDALHENGGIWFGWNGQTVEKYGADELTKVTADGITFVTMPLSQHDYEHYYIGFSNSVLWPVFHYRLDLARWSAEDLAAYRTVNERFAAALAGLIEPDDLVWVHDYHLIPLASALRRLGIGNRIGFFLHIPFPPPDILEAMPEHRWLVECLLDYDVVGFQTNSDHANFFRSACDLIGATILKDGHFSARGRTMNAAVFPIGIDVEAFEALAATPEAQARIARLNRSGESRVNVIGVDRLDYTKGLPDRLRAFRRLLELYPENLKATTLMQIAPPTREDLAAYSDIRAELESLSGSINGEFGDFDWTPVRYIHRLLSRDTLAALYRGSRVGLVTPLRDGMNLVAKEYIAAQAPDDPGVLVLSKFAGAAEELSEALIVNPYNNDEVAEAVSRALHMPVGERRELHTALLKRIRKGDARYWRRSFVERLEGCSLRQ